jgi:hypothetical protein
MNWGTKIKLAMRALPPTAAMFFAALNVGLGVGTRRARVISRATGMTVKGFGNGVANVAPLLRLKNVCRYHRGVCNRS